MKALPIMFVAWAAFATGFVALMIYRGNLTRYEEDQLFLSDNRPHEQQLQTAIVRKVNRLQPFVHIFGGAAALLTITIVGLYVWAAWQKIS